MAVNRTMPRVQEVLLPYLREHLPEVNFYTWVPEPEKREFPLVNIRRLAGLPINPHQLDRAVIETTCYTRDGLVATENLYLDVRHLIYEMVDKQIVIPDVGYLHSYFETMGPMQFDSPFDDTWRVQGLIQLGVRPPR